MMIGWGEAALVALVILCALGSVGVAYFQHAVTAPQKLMPRFLSFISGAALLFSTLAILEVLVAFLASDFRYVVVSLHSHTLTPLLYKVSALWAHHEGSMLLWLWILVCYTVVATARVAPAWRTRTVGVLWALIALMGGYILVLSSPYVLVADVPSRGLDLNPLLQDPAVALHPPLLYLGLVGFAVPFALTLGALLSSPPRLQGLGAQLRPWILLPWGFLTLGIALGSYWAYYELGWGGWWFWDPVENAALMPWLMGLGLMHSVLMFSKGGGLPRTTTAMALGTFLFCLLGTFLVRSNLIASVHSFATDPIRGQGLFALFVLATCVSVWAWGGKLAHMKGPPIVSFFSRELALGGMVVLTIILTFTVALGTLYPLAMEALNGITLSVGAPYFNNVFVPIATFGLFLMAFGIHLPWRQGTWAQLKDRLLRARTFFIPMLVLLWGLYYGESAWLWLLLAVSAWGFSANLVPRSKWQLWPPKSMSSLAHMAAAAFLGFASIDAFTSRTQDIVLAEGEETIINPNLRLRLTDVERIRTPTYMAERYHLAFKGPFGEGMLMPERRFYPSRQVLTTEVALRSRGLSQLYVAATPPLPNGKRAFKVSQHDGVMGIWLAACVMALSAFLCMLKRKRTDRETPS